MPDAHTSWDCVEAQWGDDAWQNEDVDWPHQRLECNSPSSTREPCDGFGLDHVNILSCSVICRWTTSDTYLWCVTGSVQDTAPVPACKANVLTASTVARRRSAALQRPSFLAAARSLNFTYIHRAVRNLGMQSWEPALSRCTCSTYSSRVPAFSRLKFF